MNSRLTRYAMISVIGVCSLVLLVFFSNYVVGAIAPFIIGWCTALLLKTPARKLSGIVHVNERLLRLLLAMLAATVILLAITLFLWYIVNKSWQFLSNLDGNSELVGIIDSLFDGGFFSKYLFGGELGAYIKSWVESLAEGFLSRLADGISEFATKLPGGFIFVLVTVIATAYFAYDLDKINRVTISVLPKRIGALLLDIKSSFASVGIKYLRSYLVIMLITFVTLLVGLLILGVEYAVLIALLVAFLDILPVLGVGTVLLPWSIIAFLSSNIKLGIGLIILFVFISVLREVIEPKILGRNLGLHPILTLLLLYLGYSFFGIGGMIILPPLGALASVVLKKRVSDENNSAEVEERAGAE